MGIAALLNGCIVSGILAFSHPNNSTIQQFNNSTIQQIGNGALFYCRIAALLHCFRYPAFQPPQQLSNVAIRQCRKMTIPLPIPQIFKFSNFQILKLILYL